MAPSESFDALKQAGDAAVKSSDFAAAQGHYTAALELLPADSSQRAALLCNRAFARLQLKDWQSAAEDGTAVLAVPGLEEKLRVKALFRRALAREALGQLEPADVDLNLALKSAPGNEGIVAAAKRVRAALPKKELRPAWVPGQPYTTAAVLRLAEAVAGAQRGYLGLNGQPCVRFACGAGVQAFERTGSLFAIREALGPAQKAPLGAAVATLDRDYHARPNFDPEDGLNVEYDRGGNLKVIFQQRGEELNGPWATFNADGSMNLRETFCYRQGRVVSKLKSDVPGSFMAHVLRELVVPVKKALGVGLAPGEEELCSQHGVDADVVAPASLSVASGPERPPRLEPFAAPAAPATTSTQPTYGFGATWEELLNAPPAWEVGPAWVGPTGEAEAAEQATAPVLPDVKAPVAFRPDEKAPAQLLALQGLWVDEAADTPVGRIEGAMVVWHRSFRCRPTRLRLGETGAICMELEGKSHEARLEGGPRTRLRWSDGDVWIRVSGAPS